MKLCCKNCNDLLTPKVLLKSEIDELSYIDEEELLQEGKFIEASKVEYNFGIPIEYLINSKSIILKNHSESIRLQGCCGPSEFDKLNQVCVNCNNEIGVLIADCWTSKFIGVNMSKVSLKRLW
ncbi:hypothetical protein SAMN04489761_2224 [Tenacibaculum sp. MAR_2009_124]|nr:hypothetical protein SAMN04489761_2224 [Tenacibaculum sp. MAR_2009_124]